MLHMLGGGRISLPKLEDHGGEREVEKKWRVIMLLCQSWKERVRRWIEKERERERERRERERGELDEC